MDKKSRMNPTYKTFSVLFCVIILSVVLTLLLSEKKTYSRTEKRSLASFPTFTLEAVKSGDFMDGLETFLADQFPIRDRLMKFKSTLDLALGIREAQDVFMMTDGSLAERFTEPAPEKTQELLAELTAFAERYGADCSMTFLLAPTAVNAHSDLLPEHAPTDDQNVYIDTLFSGLSEQYSVLDVRSRFSMEAAAGVNLYYLTDHHWKTEAAGIAAEMYLSSLGINDTDEPEIGVVCSSFYGSLVQKSGYSPTKPDSVSICRVTEEPENDFLYSVSYPYSHEVTASLYSAEALKGDDPYQVFFGGNHPMVTIETTLETGRRLLIIKDSYANCFVPFLVRSFDLITVVDPRYYYDDLDLLISENRFTDILFLYNANTLSEDSSLAMVLRNEQ